MKEKNFLDIWQEFCALMQGAMSCTTTKMEECEFKETEKRRTANKKFELVEAERDEAIKALQEISEAGPSDLALTSPREFAKAALERLEKRL